MHTSNILVFQKRLEDAEEFCGHYERFVDCLCNAARLGVDEKTEETFEIERRWLQTHYFLIRSEVAPFVPTDPKGDPNADPFQQLFEPESLACSLHSDDGNMISRIVRTRDALDAYAEHLASTIERGKSCS